MIASDHPIMRDGLRLRIQQERDMYVVCEAGDLAQILRDLQICRPDVVVLDLHLPRGAGARAISRIRGLSPMMPLVILANDPAELTESRSSDILTVSKISASEEVIPAIRKAIGARRIHAGAAPRRP